MFLVMGKVREPKPFATSLSWTSGGQSPNAIISFTVLVEVLAQRICQHFSFDPPPEFIDITPD